MRRCLIGMLLLIWLCSSSVVGQARRQVDSLRRVLASSPAQDTARVRTMLHLSYQLFQINQGRAALQQTQQALHLARRLRWELGVGMALQYAGDLYYDLGDFSAAHPLWLEALTIWKKHGDLSRASEVVNGLANLQSQAQEYEHAIRLNQEALRLAHQAHDTLGLVRAYVSMGGDVAAQGNLAASRRWHEQALALAERHAASAARYRIMLLNNLGDLHIMEGQPERALPLLQRARRLALLNPNDTKYNLATILATMAQAYDSLQQPRQALVYALLANKLATRAEAKQLQGTITAIISRLYAKTNNYEQAYRYSEAYHALQQQLVDQDKARAIADIQARYEAQQQERDIQILTQRNQIQRLATRQQRTLRNVALGSSVLLLGLTGAVYYRYRRRQRLVRLLNAQNQEKVLLLKEVHHRVKNNLQIVLSLLSSQLKSLREPAAIEALRESRTRVQSMALVHQNLYQTNSLTSIPVRPYLTELVQAIARAYQSEAATVAVHLDLAEAQLSTGTVMPLGLIVNELVTNAFKYAYATSPRPPQLHVTLHPTGPPRTYQLLVADNGGGLPALELGQVRSLGLRLVVGLSRQLKATLAVERPGQGTCFSLVFSEPDEPGTAS
ncbi:histidine kinase dimerization/phosphoacceptor domain -containing protein [Hymenobacter weizhouensis]|uniref:histidine kinase dimerization/phosphoacceptor domain -containing protein n=1 Tax=Hymenobacter sp. YIM 151500-1 TaxID=2987689 RepID=UPI002225BA97|nr:histidine kinase dimerization/phosphoacceptor domain -containing protein [Hymenobacter sp. YIM 151500-1]UYZ63848.1 hypothetical protein OIS53_03155 [Hymenobacter sp. YIM 151500-1]